MSNTRVTQEYVQVLAAGAGSNTRVTQEYVQVLAGIHVAVDGASDLIVAPSITSDVLVNVVVNTGLERGMFLAENGG